MNRKEYYKNLLNNYNFNFQNTRKRKMKNKVSIFQSR